MSQLRDDLSDLTLEALQKERPDLVEQIEGPLKQKIDEFQAQFFRRLGFRIGKDNQVYINPEWLFEDILGR